MTRSLVATALFLLPGACLGDPGTHTTTPREDPDVVLHNPDMGWVLYENYPLDPRPGGTGTMNVLPQAIFEGCDHAAVMFAWSDVAKEEGRLDWSRVDAACDHWARRGKGIHLRISTEPLFGWSCLQPQGGMGIPEWLLARIPDHQKARRTDGPLFGWHVDARNPLYQKYLREFLREANDHFKGPLMPLLVDLRGFGRWGEWHSGYPYASLGDKRAALESVLGIWSESFPGRMLALSYSHDPDGPEEYYAGPWHKLDPAFTGTYDDYLRFSAFDLALKKANITLRRDGAGGGVSPNERKLCEHFYRDLRRAPQASEFVCGYTHARSGGPAFVKAVVDDALSLHPNYIGLLGYGGKEGLAFMLERPDLVAHGLRTMGYRLVPLEITLPKEVTAGEPFTLRGKWTNRAVGRALRDYHLRVRLATASGEPLAETDTGPLPTSAWLHGDTATTASGVVFGTIAGATTTAKLLISLHDPVTARAIALPLAKRTRDEFCEVGEVSLYRKTATGSP